MSSTPIVYPTAEILSAALAQLPAGWLGELGERLREDAGGELRERYISGFDAASDKARARLARPLPEADFGATQATVDACAVARSVLDVVWQAMRAGAGQRDPGS
jgi:hypothetical protein